MFGNVYNGIKVLVTGHTGFKGSWLCTWLTKLGATVCGVSLPMDTEFAHWNLLNLELRSEFCDIRNPQQLKKIFKDFQPAIVFHLAAQPIVRLSYARPTDTFASNVMGTVNLLEACRETASVRAIVAITSDKCYENYGLSRGYREEDPMGGYDPYSASKGCAELVISSYRRSFFNPADYGTKHLLLLASARAGNVIGGGDWAQDRLVPDLIRAAAAGQTAVMRNPDATRPWQHVLEPLGGYLLLGQRLLAGDVHCAEGWNFGPKTDDVHTVREAASMLAMAWDAIRFKVEIQDKQPHEARMLQLDCNKAQSRLGWHAALTAQEAFRMTAEWYREFYHRRRLLTFEQIQQYTTLAIERKLEWTI